MIALKNADFYTELGVITDKCLLISGETIVGFVDFDDVPSSSASIDLCGLNVSAGFIDIQVNGGGGVLLNDSPDLGAIIKISSAHRRFGTTSFLPTLITSSHQVVLQAISATKEAMCDFKLGVLGLHLEGPFIEESKAGVHDKSFTRAAEEWEVDCLLEKGVGVIALLTFAPEVMPVAFLRKIVSRGVKVFFGHTNASYDLLMEYVREGATGATHLFNAMSQLGSREPGLVGLALGHEGVVASIIADGHHVAWASVSAAKRAMGESLFLVTDAMPLVGDSRDTFVLGPYQVERRNNKLTTAEGTLAGSCLDMASAVRNCVQKVGVPLPEALRMASMYPARALGVFDRLGSIASGKTADLVIFNNQLRVAATFKNGLIELHDEKLLPNVVD